jgi:hypothetical protein
MPADILEAHAWVSRAGSGNRTPALRRRRTARIRAGAAASPLRRRAGRETVDGAQRLATNMRFTEALAASSLVQACDDLAAAERAGQVELLAVMGSVALEATPA